MQIIKILSLGLLATALWNCNDATQPESTASKNSRIPAIINGMTKMTAEGAGYSALTSPTTITTKPTMDPFDLSTEEIKSLNDAGICQGFVDLLSEMNSNSASIEAGVIPPRLQEVSNCFAAKANLATSNESSDGFFSIFNECFCGSSGGGVFGNFESTLFTKYAAPKTGLTYTAPVTGTPYSAPSSPGGSGFTASGKAATGYKAPNL